MQDSYWKDSPQPQSIARAQLPHSKAEIDSAAAGCAPRPADPLSISIVSNSRLLSEGLAALLGAHLDFEFAGGYATGDVPNGEYYSPSNHVALIDGNIGLPGVAAWTWRWRGCAPPASVVVLELANDPAAILNCIEAGASGYTLRGATGAEVAEVIRHICRGRALCSPEVTAQLFKRLANLRADRAESNQAGGLLTQRELEVLRLIAANYGNKEIAAALVIEVRTVKHHVHNILEKLKLRHRWDAARVAVERGWAAGGE
jgi:DNA-binding NarL/FixJ family response regulator